MKDPEVLAPIQCPECRQERLVGFPVALVADALLSGSRLRMSSRCHCAEWFASAAEMEQIRQYLRAGCIGPRNDRGRYAADVSENFRSDVPPRGATRSLRGLERPTYTRRLPESAASQSRGRAAAAHQPRSRQAARDGLTPAARVLSALRRFWVFDVVFLRRGR